MQFYQRDQKDGDTFDQFVAEVQKLAGTCEFKLKEEQIRDRIVIGMNNSKVREKIIFSNEFSLPTVIEKIRLFTLKKEELMKSNIAGSSKVDKVSLKKVKCPNCNYEHELNKCPATNKKCLKCKKLGHFAACCKGGQKVDAVDKNSSVEDLEVNLGVVKYVSSLSWYKKLMISNQVINFKLDTGAQINTITENICKKFRNFIQISSSNKIIESLFRRYN